MDNRTKLNKKVCGSCGKEFVTSDRLFKLSMGLCGKCHTPYKIGMCKEASDG